MKQTENLVFSSICLAICSHELCFWNFEVLKTYGENVRYFEVRGVELLKAGIIWDGKADQGVMDKVLSFVQ